MISKIYHLFIRKLHLTWIFSGPRQIQIFENYEKSSFIGKLLIVAPGHIEVPSMGWGAVETIISETISEYSRAGFITYVINSRHPKDWHKIRNSDFDVILSHSDDMCKKIRRIFPNTPLVVVSHYGFGAFPEYWHKGYRRVLKGMEVSDYIVCLSKKVLETYKIYVNSKVKLIHSPNGSNFNPITSNQKLKDSLLILGKIEDRKMQYEVWQTLKNSKVIPHFVGPIVDKRVLGLLAEDKKAKEAFLGSWSRDELIKKISDYSALLMISKGEADALVLYEAQLAGLPILVSQNAIGSQSTSLPWIRILSENPTATEIELELSKCTVPSKEISEYARNNYNWNVRNFNLTTLLSSLAIDKRERSK